MAITVKKLALWSAEIGNQPGTLGDALRPFAEVGADLEVVMAYEKPGDPSKSVVEIAPVSGVKATRAAQSAGFSMSSIPSLLVEGDNRPGLGRQITAALGAAGINIHFLVTLVAGRKYRSVFGFGRDADMSAAAKTIKGAAAAKPRKS
jgi:hypothetical protein